MSHAVVICEHLAAGAIVRQAKTKKFCRNILDSMLVLLLGRLVIDKRYWNRGLASVLMRAVSR